MTTEKPVVVNATITAAVSSIIPAITLVVAAFSSWTPTEDQTTALSALTIAVIGVVTAFLSKNAASKVFVPSSVAPLVEAAKEEGKQEVLEQINTMAPTVPVNPGLLPQTPYPYHPIHGATGGVSHQGDGNE